MTATSICTCGAPIINAPDCDTGWLHTGRGPRDDTADTPNGWDHDATPREIGLWNTLPDLACPSGACAQARDMARDDRIDHRDYLEALCYDHAALHALIRAATNIDRLSYAEESADPTLVPPHGCNLHAGVAGTRAALDLLAETGGARLKKGLA